MKPMPISHVESQCNQANKPCAARKNLPARTPRNKILQFIVPLLAALTLQIRASGQGFDNASDPAYLGGNYIGKNGGTGFGPWVVSVLPNGTTEAGIFIASSTVNGMGGSLGIDSAGSVSFGFLAHVGSSVIAIRPFQNFNVLGQGQTFSIDFDNGLLGSGSESVGLYNNNSGHIQLVFSATAGDANYKLLGNHVTGSIDTGVPITANGVHLAFTLLSPPGTPPGSMSVAITPNGGATTTVPVQLDFGEGDLDSPGLIGFTVGMAGVGTGDAYKFFVNNMGISAAGPAPSTAPATQVTPSAATLNGTVNPNGAATTAWFEWGKTAAYGNSTPSANVGQGVTAVAVSAPLMGLTSGDTYHFRMDAANNLGTTYGADMTFTTSASSPLLHIGISGSNAMLSWPTNFAGYTLESTASLNSAAWRVVPGTPAIMGGQYVISAGPATNNQFFRLALSLSGTALGFDGASSYVSVGAAPLAPPWTAEFWVNRQDAPNYSASLLGDGSTALKLEQFNFTRQVGFTQFGVADYLFNYTAPANTWVHLAFVCDTSTRLYVNGVLQDSNQAVISLPLNRIGYDSSGFPDYLNGTLDEVRVWNVARTSAQIQANMNHSLAAPQANLVGYWRFDEGIGTSASDSSGSGKIGTLENSTAWVSSGAPLVP